jgi:ABC-type branched-subunit amino acid transport system substrate-binding protein
LRPDGKGAAGPKRGRVPIRLVLCLAVLLPLTGCRFPGTVRPTIKIGLVAPFEGRYRYVGYDVIYAVRLALREANGAGGVAGYSVELVAYDDGADPEMAVQQARKLAVDPEVVAVIGHFRDETTEAAAAVYDRSGMPLLAPAVLSTSLTDEYNATFRFGPPASALAQAVVDCAGQDPAVEELLLVDGGGSLGSAVLLEADRRSIDVQALSSPAELADGAEVGEGLAVVCSAQPLSAAEAAIELREAGWTGRLLGGPALLATDFASVAGSAAEGALAVSPWPLVYDVSGSDSFRESYQAMGYHVGPPGTLALPAYEATWAVLDALDQDIRKAGSPSRAGVASALAGTRRSGQLGLVVIDGQREWGGAPLYWYEIQEGIPSLLTRQQACAPGR